ncbi:hypothetical protein FRX31_030405 [Thalictrum thalictroides]|uniref:Reverse transcriptase zinc-binding domain-containing protein n=1 Tax=Thalictrum thalictroides TaxID=46969 RepID=A0A7J6V4M4_THATH|nr:hypothetical protein FRX31_030405 [Thalictrum thalictroides]
MDTLLNLLNGVSWEEAEDKCEWIGATNKCFSVRAFYDLLWFEVLKPRSGCYTLILTSDSVEELLIAWPKAIGLHLGKRVWELLPYAVIWTLWRIRNDRIFKEKMVSMERMVVEVKTTLWYWVGNWPGRRSYCFQDMFLCWFELLNGLLVKSGSN